MQRNCMSNRAALPFRGNDRYIMMGSEGMIEGEKSVCMNTIIVDQ